MNFSACKVLSNQRLSSDFYLLEAEGQSCVKMGQFYMLRAWEHYPVLSRPISVFDAANGRISFVYRAVGQGTGIITTLKSGDTVSLLGPLGNGFPDVEGTVALVGGGAGIAPLYLAVKQIKAAHPGCCPDVFLGFSGEPFLVREFESTAGRVIVNTGGFITDDIDPAGYDHILTCGPEIMMKVLFEKARNAGAKASIHVSLENRMACGVGACFACSRPVGGSNKKVCKDGPVFPAEEVFGR
jgi:dihydroorotate dehydrogenase electron transfer subunit